MFVGLKQPFEKGKRVKGTLQFEKAGTVEVEYAVEAIGGAPDHGAMDHDMEMTATALARRSASGPPPQCGILLWFDLR